MSGVCGQLQLKRAILQILKQINCSNILAVYIVVLKIQIFLVVGVTLKDELKWIKESIVPFLFVATINSNNRKYM